MEELPLPCALHPSSTPSTNIRVYISSLCDSCTVQEVKVDMSQHRLNSRWRRYLKSFRGRDEKKGIWGFGDADRAWNRTGIFQEGISRSGSPRHRGCWPRNDRSWMCLAPIEEEVVSKNGRLCHGDSWPKNDKSWVVLSPIQEEAEI
jgi:hypothetical protein